MMQYRASKYIIDVIFRQITTVCSGLVCVLILCLFLSRLSVCLSTHGLRVCHCDVCQSNGVFGMKFISFLEL